MQGEAQLNRRRAPSAHSREEYPSLLLLRAVFPQADILIQATRGLDSFYAERSGLIVGY